MKYRLLATLSLLLSQLFLPCHAQVPIGPSVQIGPLTIFCVDALGNQVMNYAGPTNQTAVATVVNGGPAIVVDTAALGQAPWAFDVFTYAHECAHHYLGHVIHPTYIPVPAHELAADCMAAKTTRNYGWLPLPQFNVAMQVRYTFAADPAHPPGPMRVRNASACYSNPP